MRTRILFLVSTVLMFVMLTGFVMDDDSVVNTQVNFASTYLDEKPELDGSDDFWTPESSEEEETPPQQEEKKPQSEKSAGKPAKKPQSSGQPSGTNQAKTPPAELAGNTTVEAPAPVLSEGTRSPDESGTIMINMFHNFITEYQGGDKKNTMTFAAFRAYLERLYNEGYRPISMQEYLSNNITTARGYMPVVLSFDDGWASQFRLIEEGGVLRADPNSAVGVLEEFNRTHPDFALRGIFYVNMAQNPFGTVGTLSQRFSYLIERGFEIGNHTYSHADLRKLGSAGIQEEIGRNENIVAAAVPGYKMHSLALPYGYQNKELLGTILDGSFEGREYHNQIVLLAGGNPSPSPASASFGVVIPRVLAPGIEPLEMDAAWWMTHTERTNPYVSDGNADTITVPSHNQHKLRQMDKEVIVYGEEE